MVKKIATFGEIMLRLSKPDYKRLFQGRQYNENYGGSEANVAVSLAMLGDDVEFITRVPSNQVGKAACMRLNEFGVSTKQVVFGGDRLGSYFLKKPFRCAIPVSFMTVPTLLSAISKAIWWIGMRP